MTSANIKELGVESACNILSCDTSSYENQRDAGVILYKHLEKTKYCKTLLEYVDVLKYRLDPLIIEFIQDNLEQLEDLVRKNEDNDMKHICYLSTRAYNSVYLARVNRNGDAVEPLKYLHLRIAIQLHMTGTFQELSKCYEDLSNKLYTHASPTILNAGMVGYHEGEMRRSNQMSSCFIVTMNDNMEDIQRALVNCGKMSKGKGGLGIDFSQIRHSELGDTGMSGGLPPLMKLFEANLAYFNQEGLRKGAGCISTRSHHIDLISFCKYRDKLKNGESSINTSIWTSWLFWHRVRTNGDWTLFCPNKTRELNECYGLEFNKRYERLEKEFKSSDPTNAYHRVHKARSIAVEICKMQMEDGMPYLMSGDSCNQKSNQKHLGYIRSTNLCQEIVDYSSPGQTPSCNLASISSREFVDSDRKYNWDEFSSLVRRVVRNVNKVIDTNLYLAEEVKLSNELTRPLAIGTIGMAETLYKMDMGFTDPEAITFNKTYFACQYFNGMLSSLNLAVEYELKHFGGTIDGSHRGAYKRFKGSPLSLGKFQFDLWAEEYKILKESGFDLSMRTEEDDNPMSPSEWNQKEFTLPNGFVVLPTWESLRSAVMTFGVRNSLMFALMPTASTSKLVNATETVEAPCGFIYNRRTFGGSFVVICKELEEDLREIGLWNDQTKSLIEADQGSIRKLARFVEEYKEYYPNFDDNASDRLNKLMTKYKTMFEIKTIDWLKLNAARSRYICHSSSMNIYMETPTVAKLLKCHDVSSKLGLKTMIYYLRQIPPVPSMKVSVPKFIEDFVHKIDPREKKDSTKGNYVCETQCISCS